MLALLETIKKNRGRRNCLFFYEKELKLKELRTFLCFILVSHLGENEILFAEKKKILPILNNTSSTINEYQTDTQIS
jgi:hypothetical protein